MLKLNSNLTFGIVSILFCSNINATDYKSNTSMFSNELNTRFLLDDYVLNNKLEDNFFSRFKISKFKSRNNSSQLIKYSTKCRSINNPYNNHAFLEVIELTKMQKKKLKGKTYLRLKI